MNAPSREDVETLCAAALDLPPGERQAFLARSCGHDPVFAERVRALLADYERLGSTLDHAAWSSGRHEGPARHQTLTIGTCAGPYEIVSVIGAGGMGEIYKARDRRLGRAVAIKILPPLFALDPDRRRRFEQEARSASALAHPNICAVYDIGSITDEGPESPGVHYIAMEFVDGVPLHQAIPAGGLAVDAAIEFGRQLSSGLAAAHRAGIVHRDVKPANLLVARDGTLKIVDFGLARVLADTVATGTMVPGVFGPCVGPARSTAAMGTPGYAAPEQVMGGHVDARADVFAAGCVLYELLTGSPAFGRTAAGSPLQAVLEIEPPALRSVRRGIPRAVQRVLDRALAKAPPQRYPSAQELLEDLEEVQRNLNALHTPLVSSLRRPAVAAVLSTLVVVMLVGGGILWSRARRDEWVRGTAIPEVRALLQKGPDKSFAAFRLLRHVDQLAPDDPQVRELVAEATASVQMVTDPPDADVFIRDFRDPPDTWEHVGRSPVLIRVPAASPFIWKASRPGFVTRTEVGWSGLPALSVSLPPADGAAADMTPIQGGPEDLFSATVTLAPFWIDTTEVTNRAFAEFLSRGGYARQELWPEEARARLDEFVDATGHAGPATWERGGPAPGQEDHPVAGVSWFEAMAYCRSVGKDLPTIFHWYHAATPAWTTQWAALGNFMTAGTQTVGQPLRLNTHGTFDMAGNVREWTRTEADGNRHYALGGSYLEPSYRFWDHWAERPENRKPDLGFRCALYQGVLAPDVSARVRAPFHDWRKEQPVNDEVYAVIAGLYDYDRSRPLASRVDAIDDHSSQYHLERVSYAAAYGHERVRAFLLTPRNVQPPYQVVIWYPGGGYFGVHPIPFAADLDRIWWLFLVRSGRAVFFAEYKGSFERQVGSVTNPEAWREILLRSAQDLRRGIDYLETRHDVDAAHVAYYGLSLGAAVGPIMAAVEPRLRASILLGAGLYSWRKPPDADPLNFLAHVKTPTFMINGRHDYFFPVETSQVPMFDLLGARDKKHSLFESGHLASERDQYEQSILEWLDRYLGPVPR